MSSQLMNSSTISKTPLDGINLLKKIIALPIIADIVECFQSVHLAIVLLALLAIGVYLGVYFPQEGTVDPAEVQKYWGLQYGFAKAVGLNQVYSSFWFLTLQILFFFNLLIGSFKWLKPATNAALQKTFLSAPWLGQKQESFSIPTVFEITEAPTVLRQIEATLKQHHYQVYQDQACQDNQNKLYAAKGSITRLGPAMAHIGILLCLIAGFQSYLFGFKALQGAVPGQIFSPNHAEQIVLNSPKGIWQGKLPNWGIRVNDFKIDYYPIKDGKPKTPRQYYSDLSILDPVTGNEVKRETISVNHPLNYADTSIYQASFAPSGRFNVEINGHKTILTLNDQFNQRQVSVTRLPNHRLLVMFPFMAGQDPGVDKDFAMFFVRGGQDDVSGDGRMPPNGRLLPGQQSIVSGVKIKFIGPEMATGLQIKYAPEVPLMYASYLIIMLGAVLCFFSQRQLWIALQPVDPTNPDSQQTLIIYPKTNKARFSFMQEIEVLQHKLNLQLQALNQPQKG